MRASSSSSVAGGDIVAVSRKIGNVLSSPGLGAHQNLRICGINIVEGFLLRRLLAGNAAPILHACDNGRLENSSERRLS